MYVAKRLAGTPRKGHREPRIAAGAFPLRTSRGPVPSQEKEDDHSWGHRSGYRRRRLTVAIARKRPTVDEFRRLAESVDGLDYDGRPSLPRSLDATVHGVVAIRGGLVIGMARRRRASTSRSASVRPRCEAWGAPSRPREQPPIAMIGGCSSVAGIHGLSR